VDGLKLRFRARQIECTPSNLFSLFYFVTKPVPRYDSVCYQSRDFEKKVMFEIMFKIRFRTWQIECTPSKLTVLFLVTNWLHWLQMVEFSKKDV
jgi:hypothetical protein